MSVPLRSEASRTLANARTWRGAAAIIAIVMAVYAPSLGGGFVWDDDIHLLENPVFEAGGLFSIWFSPPQIINYWPLTFTSYWLEHALWGFDPLGYRVTNALLHALASIALWRVLLRLSVPLAWLAAVVFGAPPAFAWLERDEEMIGQIVETSKDLWDRVQRGDPPEPDGSREATDALEKLVSREPGRVVELDIEAVVLAEDLAALQETKKDLDRRIREHQQKIIRKLGDAEEGLLPGGGRMTYRETVRRGFLRVDWPHAADVVAALPAGTKVSESKESRFRVLRRSKK